MSEKISIRVDPELKSQLDFLARVYGIDLSKLIRDVLIPHGMIKKLLDFLKTVERMERNLVRLLVFTPEMQEIFRKLYSMRTEEEFCKGWDCQESEYIKIVAPVNENEIIDEEFEEWYFKEYKEKIGELEAITVEKKNEKYIPMLVLECGTDNSTHSMHEYSHCKKEPTTLTEFVLFLKAIIIYLRKKQDKNIDLIKSSLEKLKEMVI